MITIKGSSKIFKKILLLIIILFILSFVLVLFAYNSSYIQKKVDIYGLKNTINSIVKDFHPGDTKELEKYVKEFDLGRETLPLKSNPKIEKLNKWKIDNTIEEKYIFKSAYEYPARQNNSIFYVLRRSEIKNSKVILWVPGSGVSDFAFFFIKKFFKLELDKGYNIFVYIPAYHLERIEKSKENSQGFMGASTLQNIKNIINAVKELRSIILYLKEQNVKSIAGWGGSMGVPMLLLAEQFYLFEHLTLMIPVFDWQTIFMNRLFKKKVLPKLKKRGFSLELLEKSFKLISPINYSLKINPDMVQILYGKYDQLNPIKTIFQYSKTNGIKNVIGYDRSHATILLDGDIYNDNKKFLKSINN